MCRFILPIVLAFYCVPILAQTPVRIGGKNFTEQFLLVNMTEKYLAAKGIKVSATAGLGTLVMRQALEAKQLDLVWEYTGTALIVYFHLAEKLTGMESYTRARDLDKANNMIWLKPSMIDNGYAVTMQRSVAEAKGIKTIEDLAKYVTKNISENPKERMLFALDYEFASRPDGLKPLQKTYEVEFRRKDLKPMDPGLVYTALKNGQVLVGLAFTSDGRIKGFDLVALEDNRKFFPTYYATPVIRKEVLDKYPKIAEYMKDIAERLDTAKMMELNKKVDIDHQSVESVASGFLKAEGLLP